MRRAPAKPVRPMGPRIHRHRPIHIPLSEWTAMVSYVLDWYLSSARENVDRERVRDEALDRLATWIWEPNFRRWIAEALGVPEYPFWSSDEATPYAKGVLGEVPKQLGHGIWGAKQLQSLLPGKAMTDAEAAANGLPPLADTARRTIAIVRTWVKEADLWVAAEHIGAQDVPMLIDGVSIREMEDDFHNIAKSIEGMPDRDKCAFWEALKHDAILLHERRMRGIVPMPTRARTGGRAPARRK